MLNYLRAVKENKPLLAAYAFSGLSVLTVDSDLPQIMAGAIAASEALIAGYIFAVSLLGAETFAAVRSARRHIKETGTLDAAFQENFRSYCEATGVVAAAKAEGVEHQLSARITRRANRVPMEYVWGLALTGATGAVIVYSIQQIAR